MKPAAPSQHPGLRINVPRGELCLTISELAPGLCHEKKVSMASVLSSLALTYQFSDQFLIISGSREAGATNLFPGKKNNTLYFFNTRVENGLMQPSLNIL